MNLNFTLKQSAALCKLFALLFLLAAIPGRHVNAQTADLVIQKTGPLTVFIGQSMTYTISIQNNGPNAANGAAFIDSFPLNVTNVSLTGCSVSGGAVCPGIADYSISNAVFSGTIPTLPNGGSITFTITLNAPAPITASSFSNTASVRVPVGITDPDPSTNSSTWNTSIDCSGSVSTLPPIVVPADTLQCSSVPTTVQYTLRWVNNGPSNAAGIEFRHAMDFINLTAVGTGSASISVNWAITNLSWSATGGSAIPFRRNPPAFVNVGAAQFTSMSGNEIPVQTGGTGNFIALQPNITPDWEPGDTITLTYTLQLNEIIYTGCGRTFSFEIVTGTGVSNPGISCISTPTGITQFTRNLVSACSGPPCPIADVRTLKTESYPGSGGGGGLNCNSFPVDIVYTVRYINQGPDTLRGVRMIDIVRFNNLVNSGSGNAVYTFPWNISNVSWAASGVSNVPLTTSGQNTVVHSPISGSTAPGTGTTGTILTQLPNNETSLFAPGDTITLTYTLTVGQPTVTGCGRSITFGLSNSANVNNGSGFFVDPVSGNNNGLSNIAVSCNLAPPCLVADILTQTMVSGSLVCEDFPGQLQVTAIWVNTGPDSAHGVVLTHSHGMVSRIFAGGGTANFTFPWTITDLQWSATGLSTVPQRASGAASNPTPGTGLADFTAMSGTTTPTQNATAGTSGTSGLLSSIRLNTVSRFYAGDTIRLTYTVNLALPNVTGCGRSISFNNRINSSYTIPTSLFLSDPVTGNNSTVALTPMATTATDIVISKSVSPVLVNAGDTVTYTIEFQNGSPVLSPSAVWFDTLNVNFQYIAGSMTCSPLQGAPPCGVVSFDPLTMVLRVAAGDMPANSAMLYTYKGIATTNLLLESVNTRAYASNGCFECNPASNFTETNFQILPVELLSFDATLEDCVPSLKWQTASEFNNSGFYIYSSIDGIKWSQNGFVAGAGSTNEIQTYQFRFSEPVTELTYYRLLQEDFDGTQEWLPIAFLDASGCSVSGVRIYPNPASDVLNFQFRQLADGASIVLQIMDVSGKVLRTYQRSAAEARDIDVSDLAEGMYLINVSAGSSNHTEKIFIIR